LLNIQKQYMNGTLNLQMIILAREARALSQAEMAGQLGMSATNYSKMERGDIGLPPDKVQAIAELTHFPLNLFYQAGALLPESLGYRRRHNVPQKVLTPINAQLNLLRLQVQQIQQWLSIPTAQLPSLPNIATTPPQELAATLRKAWNITTPVLPNLTKLLEEQGILVAAMPWGTQRVDSRLILTENHQPIIAINKTLLGDRQRFSLAYELGHLLMHSHTPLAADTDIVHEANVFAAALLMPETAIAKDFEQGITIPILAELKTKWKVSMIALLYRADDLGFLTPNQKRYLIQQFNQLNIRRREPTELDIAPENPTLLKHYLAKYRSKTKLGTVELATLLGMYIDDFMEWYG
jgi:Zn-dependent peptidase ImmA (M78 family)/DNA-binding XRE family transcriptional regulator